MALKDLKFAESEFSGQDIASLPDRPGDAGISAQQLKDRFDQIGKVMLALGAFNRLVEEISATTGAAEIGAVVAGLSGENVQELLSALKDYEDAHRDERENPHAVTKEQVGLGNADNTADADKPVSTAQQMALDLKVDKKEGMGLSQNSFTNEEKEKLAGAADAKNVLLIDNETPYTPTKSYHPATKEYADGLAFAAGAVTSVFGRAGAVTAQAGDYTAEMVGAAALSHTHTAEDVGAAALSHTHTAEDVGAAASSHTHTAEQVGAAASSHTHTAEQVGAAPTDHTHTAADVGAAATSHTHAASAITSGTLGVARGGTGAATFTRGAALIGAGTGAITTRAITNLTAKGAVTGSTNLATANTVLYHAQSMLNRTTAVSAADTAYTTAMARGIYANTTAMTAGTTALTNGVIYLQYE